MTADPLRALERFTEWLPGELEYSVLKAPYPKKVERARLPAIDPQSIVGFLGTEWHQAQLLAKQGSHHSSEHQKTAQLQYAKFAAGIFDKIGFLMWLRNGRPDNMGAMKESAEKAGSFARTVLRHPSAFGKVSLDEVPNDISNPRWDLVRRTDHQIPFAFEFEDELTKIQERLAFAAEVVPSPQRFVNLKRQIIEVGVRATAGYLNYAVTYLDDSELVLAKSQSS